MTKKQYNRATELKACITETEQKINEANRIICLRKNNGMCKQYWDDIINILWNDKDGKETFDEDLFAALACYRESMRKEKEKLEKQFEEL